MTEAKSKGAANQRVRKTQASIEAQQFSSVRLPRKPEVIQNTSAITNAAETAGADFDPIPNDGMFVIVENSSYWPPPPLASIRPTTEDVDAGDGMDLYDRRKDDRVAKARATKLKGELNHPRGKPKANSKVVFSEDD